MAIKVSKDHFSGSGKVWDKQTGLTAILRGILTNQAKLAVANATVIDFTDNSTGSNVALVDLPIAVAGVDASATAVGAPKAGLDTALGKLDNAFAVLAQNMNIARTRLGLTNYTYAGTVAVAGTIAACDKTVTGVSGVSAATKSSVNASLKKVRDRQASLLFALNECLVAIGATPLASPFKNAAFPLSLTATGTTTASATGADAALNSAVSTALTNAVNNIAKMAATYNAAFAQASQATVPLDVVAG